MATEEVGAPEAARRLAALDRLLAEDASFVTRHEAVSRSWIARLIIIVFGVAVAMVVGLLLVSAWQTGNWDDASDSAVDLLKTVMLPIVTLVLGYYFGQSSKFRPVGPT